MSEPLRQLSIGLRHSLEMGGSLLRGKFISDFTEQEKFEMALHLACVSHVETRSRKEDMIRHWESMVPEIVDYWPDFAHW